MIEIFYEKEFRWLDSLKDLTDNGTTEFLNSGIQKFETIELKKSIKHNKELKKLPRERTSISLFQS